MDCRFNKTLLVILSLSSLLLSTNAVPSTRFIDVISTSFPAAVHKSITTSFPAAEYKSISTSFPAAEYKSISTSFPAVAPSSGHYEFTPTNVPAAAPSSRYYEFTPTNVPAAAPSSGVIASGDSSAILEQASQSGYPEIAQLCIDGENIALCAETILKQMTGPFDPLKALEIAVDATLDQAMTVAGTIDELLRDPSTDKKAMDALGVCEEEYDDMLDAIEETVDLLQNQNIVDAYYKFNSVLSLKSTCDDAFAESPGVTMPFSQDSQILFQLGGNCLGIMNDLVNHAKI
ncbi:unnamed protein product [Lathyrus sativus]|nr:unnamed protein product [Lathyrus sativus]